MSPELAERTRTTRRNLADLRRDIIAAHEKIPLDRDSLVFLLGRSLGLLGICDEVLRDLHHNASENG